jgi:hypothetical protein
MIEALAQAPAVNGPFILSVLSRVFHIGSAIIIGGGLFYMRTILAPSGAEACFAGRRELWAKWVGIATFLLLASGIFNLVRIIQQAKASGVEIPATYHALFGAKFLLAIFVMFVAAILAGKTDAADRFRTKMSKWLNLGWSAVLAIVVIGAILRSIRDSLPLEAIAQ